MRKPPQPSRFGPPSVYRDRWQNWVNDPLIKTAGLTFDRTPSGPIIAPPGKFRVCAYHIDFDERPTCWLDVDTRAEAIYVCENLGETAAGWNVDDAVAFDDTGGRVSDKTEVR
jgi:hypothetical protein